MGQMMGMTQNSMPFMYNQGFGTGMHGQGYFQGNPQGFQNNDFQNFNAYAGNMFNPRFNGQFFNHGKQAQNFRNKEANEQPSMPDKAEPLSQNSNPYQRPKQYQNLKSNWSKQANSFKSSTPPKASNLGRNPYPKLNHTSPAYVHKNTGQPGFEGLKDSNSTQNTQNSGPNVNMNHYRIQMNNTFFLQPVYGFGMGQHGDGQFGRPGRAPDVC